MAQDTGTQIITIPAGGSFTYEHDAWAGVLDHALWPLVILILGLVLLVRFREPLSALLRNINGAEGFGAKITVAPQQVALDPPKEPPSKLIDSRRASSEGHLPIDGHLTEIIGADPPATDKDDGETLNFEVLALQHSVDEWRRSWRFERIYGFMYGTQILLLLWLRSPVRDVSRNDVEAWFRSNAAHSVVAFDTWLQFLVAQELISVSTITALGFITYRLTQLGVEFVDYVSGEGLSTAKPG